MYWLTWYDPIHPCRQHFCSLNKSTIWTKKPLADIYNKQKFTCHYDSCCIYNRQWVAFHTEKIYIYIHLYFTKEMVVVKTHTTHTYNKENTISKHKVNMTISIVKNMTINLQSILEWFTSTHKFFIFSRNFLVRLSKRTLGSSKPNMCWQESLRC